MGPRMLRPNTPASGCVTRAQAAVVAGCACMFVIAAPAGADEHIHSSLARGPRIIRNILILPPKVAIVRVGLRGAEARPAQAAQLEHDLADLIDRAVRERVWSARTTIVASPETPEERYIVGDLQSRYDRLADLMHRKRRGVNSGRYSLTDAVQSVKGAEPGAVLMFTRFTGVTATVAAELLLTNAAGELFVAFADAITGDILFLSQRKVAAGTNLGLILVQLKESFKKIPRERFANTDAPPDWSVVHIHSFGQPCEGWLYIEDGKMGFRSVTKKEHAWEAPLADVAEVDDTFGWGFHVKLHDGRNFKFAAKGIGKNELLARIAAARK